MIVSDLMTSPARTCSADSSCSTAAQIMWDADCGCVPVIGPDGALAGIVTDRDLCMATHTTGLPLSAIPVRHAMATQPTFVKLDAKVDAALAQMASAQVHRLPVVDATNRVVGVLALTDVLAARAGSLGKTADTVITTLAAVTRRRGAETVVSLSAPTATASSAKSAGATSGVSPSTAPSTGGTPSGGATTSAKTAPAGATASAPASSPASSPAPGGGAAKGSNPAKPSPGQTKSRRNKR